MGANCSVFHTGSPALLDEEPPVGGWGQEQRLLLYHQPLCLGLAGSRYFSDVC